VSAALSEPMQKLLARIKAQPGLWVGGTYRRQEGRTAIALEKRGLIKLTPKGTGRGFTAEPVLELEQITVAQLIDFLQSFRGDESVFIAVGDIFVAATSAMSTENTVTIEGVA
jgi:hypothetical protein